VFPTPDAIGDDVAARILRGISEAAEHGRRYLLGLPTGRTPRPVYAALTRLLRATPHTLAHVTLVMMDEYLVETSDGYAYAIDTGGPSCHAFTDGEITGPLNAAVPQGMRMRSGNVWYPDPADPGSYDDDIAIAGGIDFFLLASGAGDGHVAFNPPGSALDSRSRVIGLAEQTRRDNLETFPALGTLERVPRFGVSVGLGTIRAAREAVMVAWGVGKRDTVRRLRAATRFERDWPATIIHACPDGEIVVDEAAAGTDM
jgi:glucosamine-6-phosphate deaminase